MASYAPSPDSNRTAGGGASKYLAGLPSRGLFSSTVISSNPGGMRVYICDRDTSPPESQLIKTNQTNILIRSLMLKKQKGDSSSKDAKSATPNEASRKRAAAKALDSRASVKRAVTNGLAGCQQGGGSEPRAPERNLQSLTVERLRALLKEKGLSLRGKKGELVERLRDANGQP